MHHNEPVVLLRWMYSSVHLSFLNKRCVCLGRRDCQTARMAAPQMPFWPGSQGFSPPAARYYSVDVECVATGTGEHCAALGAGFIKRRWRDVSAGA
jgi:hypothetical protein